MSYSVIGWTDAYGDYPTTPFTEERKKALVDRIRKRKYNFKIKYNKFSVLVTGNINKNADKKMCKRYKNELQSNILKLPHHGDYWTASSHTLISTVKPDYGIICDSKFLNKFYWNHRITSRYSLYNVPLLYKNTEGTICVESDGSSYNIYSE